MKKLIVKQFIFSLFVLLFFLLVNLLYNQNGETFAQDDTIRLVCGKEIPNGEAMNKTGELLFSLITELSAVNENAYQEIKSAEEMIESAGECNVSVCQPVNCGSYDCSWDEKVPCPPGVPGNCTIHHSRTCCNSPSACSSPWNLRGENRACPQAGIEDEFTKTEEFYRKIETSKKEIWALIDGTYGGLPQLPEVDRTESLCPRINEDIKTPSEALLCVGCPDIPNPLCPKITKIEVIGRKLNKARTEFDRCYIPPSDWEKVAKREKSGKTLLNCNTVMSQNLPRETKTIQNVSGQTIPVCTSPHNYFCCH